MGFWTLGFRPKSVERGGLVVVGQEGGGQPNPNPSRPLLPPLAECFLSPSPLAPPSSHPLPGCCHPQASSSLRPMVLPSWCFALGAAPRLLLPAARIREEREGRCGLWIKKEGKSPSIFVEACSSSSCSSSRVTMGFGCRLKVIRCVSD